MPTASIQPRRNAWTSFIGGVRKRRVISPGTSVNAAISRQRAITREERSVYVPVMVPYWLISKRTPEARLDIAVWLVCRHEDLVGVVLTESREIDQEAVLVRHADLNVIDLGHFFECALGHGIEGL